MNEYLLSDTLKHLTGPSKEQIIVNNQWASVAFGKYHANNIVKIKLLVNEGNEHFQLKLESSFSKAAMKEEKYMAFHGAESLAWFLMSVLNGYKYLSQSEIGEGCDYRFYKDIPNDANLNFLSEEFEFIEISGIMEESKTNTIRIRLKQKHLQLTKGTKRDEPSSIIVSLFKQPTIVKVKHK
ncbi:MAG: hypothetical protein ABI844_12770 [Saprospiraceae bacterium]